MTNRTTPTKGGLIAAIATYLAMRWQLPPEMAAILTGAIVTGVTIILPEVISDPETRARVRKSLGLRPVFVVALIGGALAANACTAIIPSWREGEPAQFALLDRLPGSDQQHETSTITGFSIRDLAIGVGQRDVTRNPVGTEPLHGVGFRRTQDVNAALGDTIQSDITSGDAFEQDPVE